MTPRFMGTLTALFALVAGVLMLISADHSFNKSNNLSGWLLLVIGCLMLWDALTAAIKVAKDTDD